MFSPQEYKQYSRHFILPEIGYEGQRKLKAASVLVIGAGGLGCPALQYLASTGIGHIGIIDDDVVDSSNLQRQILYAVGDVGKKKALVATQKLKKINPFIEITPYPIRLNPLNANNIINDYDLIIDGTDNIETRYLINSVSNQTGKAFIYGAIERFIGYLSVFNYENGPDYTALFPKNENNKENDRCMNCSSLGVLSILPGIIGSLQAIEVVKITTGIGEVLSGKLLIADVLKMQFSLIHFAASSQSENQNNGSCPPDKHLEKCAISLSALKKEAKKKRDDPIIIDIRKLNEFNHFHLPGSIHIHPSEIDDNLQKIPKTKKVVFVCKHGNISKQIVKYLNETYQYHNLWYLKEGIVINKYLKK